MASGLLEWSNAIRFTIANDPGRHLFKDQVNDHGFMFLEDYLANILQGASKQDPMIELVKTPGRKKGLYKQTKVASKLNHTMSSQSTLQDALPLVDDSAPKARNLAGFHDIEPQSIHVHAIHVSDHSPPPDFAVPASHRAPLLAPSHSEQKDLSIIAEDDESCDVPHNQLPPSNDPPQESTGKRESDTSRLQLPSSGAEELAPTETQVPLHIPPHVPPMDTALGSSTPPPIVASESHLYSRTETVSAVSNTPMPPSSGNPSGHHLDAQNETVLTSASPQEAVDPNTDTLPIVDGKFGTMLYPALPGPIPLRKSIRAPRDPSINAAPSNLATPGATLGANRTSWLKKAREAKALETTSRSTFAPPPPVVSTSKNLKRKSGEMDLISTTTGPEKEDRRHKSAKNVDSDAASSMREASEPEVWNHNHVRMSPEISPVEKPPTEQEGMLDRFKRTVEGLGARVGKSMGKSLGGGAVAAALAEARAAAEARVVERVTTKELLTAEGSNPTSNAFAPVEAADTMNANPINPLHSQPRHSVSDLLPPTTSSFKVKSRGGEESPQPSPYCETLADAWNKAPAKSQITTHASSPSTIRQQCSVLSFAPVFNKPPPVFIPPVTLTSGPDLPAPKTGSQTTCSPSDALPATHFERFIPENTTDALDETDTWSTTSKQTIGAHWLGGGGTLKDDSQTWSTLASQEGETRPVPSIDMLPEELVTCGMTSVLSPPPDVDMDDEYQEEIMLEGDLDESETTRSESQMSFTSSQSSKALGTTSGTSKRGKAEVKKVLQKAAVAAKKQQEENDKKAVRLKEMENRRQLAAQRKLEEEKAKAQEQERKMKEEGERRKRDREENAEKRPSKLITSSKKDEETMKKRKVTVVEMEKKETKKPPSKSILKSAVKAPIALSSSTAFNASSQMNSFTVQNLPEAKTQKQPMSLEKGKAKLPPPGFKRPQGVEDDFSRPSQLVQIQMAARAKAQLQAAAQLAPEPIPSENIDLPDINSEYSDSEDEDRPKTFDPPGWAQSPELLEALHLQSTINPDDIFGTIQPLKMEELFKTRTSRFRARTSSANWTGADRLTAEEEREYSKRMGFR